MKGVLNETTKTVHKHEIGKTELQTECGLTHHVAPDQLQTTSVEQATADFDARKCGRCFEEGGGY